MYNGNSHVTPPGTPTVIHATDLMDIAPVWLGAVMYLDGNLVPVVK